jgi:hypothetical protein
VMDSEEEKIYGMFYTAFRKETWWWEITVAARKIIIALIGVFGAEMGDMQVHLTSMLVFLIVLVTSQIRPFGGLKHGVLHVLEMASLMATFFTLWAGSVFNARPRCEDPLKGEGSTLVWCDTLSFVVGLSDIIVLAAIGVCFVYIKVEAARETARLAELNPHKKKKESFLSNGLSSLRKRFGSRGGEVELTSFENPMQDKGVQNEIKKKNRNSRMKKVRKKLSIGARVKRNSLAGGGGGVLMGGEVKTVPGAEVDVSLHVDEETGRRYSYNEATGQTQWLEESDEEDGTTNEEQGECKQRNKKRRSFHKLVSDKNEVYYKNVETGEDVWKMPEDGELVEL